MTGYVRKDTTNNIADGNVINAADLDSEFDGVQAAFNSSTGHTHDGTASEGAPITKLGPVQDVTVSTTVLGVKTTNTVDLGTSSLKFKDFYLAGNASIGGTLGVTGATTLSAALTYGGVTLSNAVTGTGNMVLSAGPTITGTITAAAANFSGAVALNGNATIGDADTDTITQAASYVTGTQLKSAKTATNTLSLAAYDVDGTAYTNLITLTAGNTPTLTLTSTGVGTINNMSIGATTASTGAFTTLSASSTTTLSAALTYGGVTLTNAVTGTGNMVLSAGPTLTGTLTAATITASGTVTGNGNWVLGNADTDTITVGAAFVNGSVLRSAKTATNTLALAAYDVDGTAYTNLITLTAANAPTLALTSTGVGTINNMSIGATTASTGAFTTLTSNGATTFTAGTASTTTGTGTLVITGGLGVSGRINAANFDGIVGANTAAAGSFTTLSATGVTTVQAGTAALPAITTTGDTNTGIFFPAADTIAFAEGGAEVARFDSSGNFGLGVTPSAWGTASGQKAFQIGTSGFALSSSGAGSGDGSLTWNGYYNGTNWIYSYTGGAASRFRLNEAGAAWLTAPSGTAGNAITFTQAMTLDASGNLLVGATSTRGSAKLDIRSDTSIALGSNASFYGTIGYSAVAGLMSLAAESGGGINFLAGATERARIDSSGNLLVGTTAGSSTERFSVLSANTSNNRVTQQIYNTAATSTTRLDNRLTRIASNGSGADVNIQFTDSVAHNYFFGGNNGGAYVVANSNGVRLSNGGTSWASDSDERLKDIIEPITDAVVKVSTLRAVIGKYKTDEDGKRRAFLIAQDVQAVLPEAVFDEQGTLMLAYTETIPLLVAAIQEQQALITQLTARITALEGA